MAEPGGVQQPCDSIVLEEEINPNFSPSEEETLEYAQWLGMDLENDKDLFWIAREGLMAPLPKNWKPCKTKDTEDIYYFNFATGESTWDHPCDGYYKNLYEEEKKKKEIMKKENNDEKRSKAKQDVELLLGKSEKKKKKKNGPEIPSIENNLGSIDKKPLPGIRGGAPLGPISSGSSVSISSANSAFPSMGTSHALPSSRAPLPSTTSSSLSQPNSTSLTQSHGINRSSSDDSDSMQATAQSKVSKRIFNALGDSESHFDIVAKSTTSSSHGESKSYPESKSSTRAPDSPGSQEDEFNFQQEKKIRSLEMEVDDLQRRNQELQDKVARSDKDGGWRDQLVQAQQTCSNLEKKIQQIQEECQDWERKYLREKAALEGTKKDSQELESKLAEQLRDIRSKFYESENEKERLSHENRLLQKKMTTMLEDHEADMQRLKASAAISVSSSSTALSSSTVATSSDQNQQIHHLEQQLEESKKKVESLEQTCQSTQRNFDQEVVRITRESNQKIQELERKLLRLEDESIAEKSAHALQVKKLQNEIDVKMDDEKKSTSKLEESERNIQEQISQFQLQLRVKDDQIQGLEQEIEGYKQEISNKLGGFSSERVGSQTAKLQELLDERVQQCFRLTEKSRNLELQVTEKAQRLQHLEDLMKQNEELKQEESLEWRKKVEHLTKGLREAEDGKQEACMEQTRLQRKIVMLEAENAQLNQDMIEIKRSSQASSAAMSAAAAASASSSLPSSNYISLQQWEETRNLLENSRKKILELEEEKAVLHRSGAQAERDLKWARSELEASVHQADNYRQLQREKDRWIHEQESLNLKLANQQELLDHLQTQLKHANLTLLSSSISTASSTATTSGASSTVEEMSSSWSERLAEEQKKWQSRVASLQESWDLEKQENEKKERQIRSLQEEILQWKQKVQDLEVEAAQQRRTKGVDNAHAQGSGNVLSDTPQACEQCRLYKEELRVKTNNYQSLKSTQESLELENENRGNRITEYQEKIRNLTEQVRKLQIDEESWKEKAHRLELEVERLSTLHHQTLQEYADNQAKRREEMAQTMKQLHDEVAGLESKTTNLQRELNKVTREKENQELEKQQLEEEITQYKARSQHQEQDSLLKSKQMMDLQDTVRKHLESISQLSSKTTDLEFLYSQLQVEQSSLTKQLSLRAQEIEHLRTENEELKNAASLSNGESANYRVEITSLRSQLSSLQERNSALMASHPGASSSSSLSSSASLSATGNVAMNPYPSNSTLTHGHHHNGGSMPLYLNPNPMGLMPTQSMYYGSTSHHTEGYPHAVLHSHLSHPPPPPPPSGSASASTAHSSTSSASTQPMSNSSGTTPPLWELGMLLGQQQANVQRLEAKLQEAESKIHHLSNSAAATTTTTTSSSTMEPTTANASGNNSTNTNYHHHHAHHPSSTSTQSQSSQPPSVNHFKSRATSASTSTSPNGIMAHGNYSSESSSMEISPFVPMKTLRSHESTLDMKAMTLKFLNHEKSSLEKAKAILKDQKRLLKKKQEQAVQICDKWKNRKHGQQDNSTAMMSTSSINAKISQLNEDAQHLRRIQQWINDRESKLNSLKELTQNDSIDELSILNKRRELDEEIASLTALDISPESPAMPVPAPSSSHSHFYGSSASLASSSSVSLKPSLKKSGSSNGPFNGTSHSHGTSSSSSTMKMSTGTTTSSAPSSVAFKSSLAAVRHEIQDLAQQQQQYNDMYDQHANWLNSLQNELNRFGSKHEDFEAFFQGKENVPSYRI